MQLSVWTGRRKEAQEPAAVPLNDLKVLLRLAREQYLKMHNVKQPRVSCVPVEKKKHTSVTGGNLWHSGIKPRLKDDLLICLKSKSKTLLCVRWSSQAVWF